MGRCLHAGFAGAILFCLPAGILCGGLVWLLGAAVFALVQQAQFRRWAVQPSWLLVSGVLAFGLLLASRMEKLGACADLILGGGFACLVMALAVRPATPSMPGKASFISSPLVNLYARLAAGASEFSYTLYLVHFPLLAFIFYTAFHGQQLAPGLLGAVWFGGLSVLMLLYAGGIWWCFERNTDRFRKWIEQVGPLNL